MPTSWFVRKLKKRMTFQAKKLKRIHPPQDELSEMSEGELNSDDTMTQEEVDKLLSIKDIDLEEPEKSEDAAMDTAEPGARKEKEPFLKSGAQRKRRIKCKILKARKKIQDYEITEEGKVRPIPIPGQTQEKAEKAIEELSEEWKQEKLARNQETKAQKDSEKRESNERKTLKASKPTGSRMNTRKLEILADLEKNSHATPKRPRPESTPSTGGKQKAPKKFKVEPGDYSVVITYDDNYKDKIALVALHYVREELAKLFRNNLLQPGTKVYRAERAMFNEQKRILINCHDEESRDWIIECCKVLIWTGPKGEKKFRGWKASEAPEGDGIKRRKFRVWIRGPRRSKEEFYSILVKQNPGINLDNWEYMNRPDAEEGDDYTKGHMLFFGIDPEGEELLRKSQFSLYYLNEKIKFWECTMKGEGKPGGPGGQDNTESGHQ